MLRDGTRYRVSREAMTDYINTRRKLELLISVI